MSDTRTALREATSMLHELYTVLVEAGFSRKQAFDMTTEVLKTIIADGLSSQTAPEQVPGDDIL